MVLPSRSVNPEPDIVDFVISVRDDHAAIQYAKDLGMLPKPDPQQQQDIVW